MCARWNDRRTIRAVVGNDHTEIYPLPDDVAVERDVMIPTRQGPRLAANVFRPTEGGPWPVIMCCTAYGKDLHPLEYALTGRGPANRSIGLDMGDMRVSEATPWWVRFATRSNGRPTRDGAPARSV
jgi:predicted acyl esterase